MATTTVPDTATTIPLLITLIDRTGRIVPANRPESRPMGR